PLITHYSRFIKLHRNLQRTLVICDTILVEHVLRDAVPLVGLVAHVPDVGDSHLAAEKAAGGKIAHDIEKCYSLLHFRPSFLGPGDFLDHFNLLILCAGNEIGVIPSHALNVEPAKTATKGRLVSWHVEGVEVDEIRNSCFTGASRVLIRGDDDIRQRGNGFHFMFVEEALGEQLLITQPFFRCAVVLYLSGNATGSRLLTFLRLT